METTEKYIELYPGSWLYNASIIGFLFSLKKFEEKNIQDLLDQNGRVLFLKDDFINLKVENRYFIKESKITSIVAKAPLYRNYLQSSEQDDYHKFIYGLKYVEESNGCSICTKGYNLPDKKVEELKKDGLENFLNRILNYNMIFNANLGPSLNEFPNAFWNMQSSNKICNLCAFLLIHQHIGFTELVDRTKVFINAPSFRLMYELNALLEKLADKENAQYKNLLAMSVIEFSIKTNVMMNSWACMDIEIVAIKRSGIVEFISLSYETIRIISNKRIAELLSSIGEFIVLNLVIDNKLNELVELGYRILKIAMKTSMGSEDRDFIYKTFYMDANHDFRNLKQFANKILKLYALIEERTNTKQHEYIR